MGKITCLEEGFAEVQTLVSCCLRLEHFALKKLQKVVKELELKVKICKEWEELKIKEHELKEMIELKKEILDLKLHKELEEIKCKREACEAHLHEELEEFKEKAELIGHAINPVEKIKRGFQEFKIHFEEKKEYYEKLAECHKPKILIFSDCDSRVDPCKILNLELSEAIVVRNVGCLVAAYGYLPSAHAAIEYAVKELKVEHILVIGHTRCDAIQSLMKAHHEEKSDFSEHFSNWLKIGEHTCKQVKEVHSSKSFEEQCTVCEKECVNLSMQNLLTYPFVKEAVAAKKISIHAGYYDMQSCAFDHWSLDSNYTEIRNYH
ncbi:hypothetical protein KP509_17G069900 [Ceratopteris richardii]|uniref:Carbonic anhydrase n=1 Tax=Ceratopteris richardii TaxID=49495 RepID=A0A8T2SZ88_CERRI|nr:hypothetical protein KP509_17G069900 [Ceratopteris richardii]